MRNSFRIVLTGPRFADAAQEQRYVRAREAWLAPRFLRIAALIAGVFLAFIPFDVIFAGGHVPRLAVVRLLIAGALMAVGWLAHVRPALLSMTVAPPLVAGMIYAGVFWTRFIVGLESEYEFTQAVMLIQVGVWFLGGMMFAAAFVVNFAGTIAFAAVELAVGVPVRHVWLSSLYLSALFVVGGFAAWHIERLFRRNFADEEELDAQRRDYRARAMRDGLTGLWNREAMEEQLAAACHRSAATKLSGAVLMLDLDRFKPINDRFGHQAGDDVLVTIARRIQSVLRAGDSVGRVGGDEFLVLAEDLPNEHAAYELVERIRREVEAPIRARLYGDSGSAEVAVGASIGISRWSSANIGVEELINAADQEMYRDKARRKELTGDQR
jgi:diguanylate cyclase (GGDEF)-like protein